MMTVAQGHAIVDHDRERLKRLAAFGPIFRDPSSTFGTWHGMTGAGTLLEPAIMPWFENSAAANRFCEMVYESGWVLANFDWTQWSDSPEARTLLADRKAIASANCEQLEKLLTTLVRRDRFEEGSLAKAYEDKILLAIIERADNLLRDLEIQ